MSCRDIAVRCRDGELDSVYVQPCRSRRTACIRSCVLDAHPLDTTRRGTIRHARTHGGQSSIYPPSLPLTNPPSKDHPLQDPILHPPHLSPRPRHPAPRVLLPSSLPSRRPVCTFLHRCTAQPSHPIHLAGALPLPWDATRPKPSPDPAPSLVQPRVLVHKTQVPSYIHSYHTTQSRSPSRSPPVPESGAAQLGQRGARRGRACTPVELACMGERVRRA